KIKALDALRADMTRRNKTIELDRLVQSLDGHFIASLNGIQKFKIVHSDTSDMVADQDAANGILKPGSVPEAGQIEGPKYKVLTTLDSFLASKETKVFVDGGKGLRRRIQLSAQAKIYDTTSGVLLEAPNVQSEAHDVRIVGPTEILEEHPTDEMLAEAAREL